jgi:hypothetical protein
MERLWGKVTTGNFNANDGAGLGTANSRDFRRISTQFEHSIGEKVASRDELLNTR